MCVPGFSPRLVPLGNRPAAAAAAAAVCRLADARRAASVFRLAVMIAYVGTLPTESARPW